MGKLIIASVIALVAASVQADQVSPMDLEPCINGGVSASGSYATQAAENLANLSQQAQALAALEYEPCVNGGVSSSGLYVSQTMEDAMEKGTASAE